MDPVNPFNRPMLEDPDSYELYSMTLPGGPTLLRTHGSRACKGRRCVLHNPTTHHMSQWPLILRADKQFLAERQCDHGETHPDPDSLDYYRRAGMAYMADHDCCPERCCIA